RPWTRTSPAWPRWSLPAARSWRGCRTGTRACSSPGWTAGAEVRDASAEPGDPVRGTGRRGRPGDGLGQPGPAPRHKGQPGPLLARPAVADLRARVQGPAPDAVAAGPADRAVLPRRGHRPGGRAPTVRGMPVSPVPGVQAGLGPGSPR